MKWLSQTESDGLALDLYEDDGTVTLKGEIGGIIFAVTSPAGTMALLLVGIGCGLKEDERFRPAYEALKKYIEEKPCETHPCSTHSAANSGTNTVEGGE